MCPLLLVEGRRRKGTRNQPKGRGLERIRTVYDTVPGGPADERSNAFSIKAKDFPILPCLKLAASLLLRVRMCEAVNTVGSTNP